MKLNVGVVGATGAVGEVFLKLLEQRNFPIESLRLFASPKSKGQQIAFSKQQIACEVLEPGCFEGLDLVFFSSGDEISREWAPQAAKSGAFAIDNSAAFRMSDQHKLVTPEVNGDILPDPKSPEVIANPNCSTIQLVVALSPLAKDFGLESVHVATYQSVSGAGKEGTDELINQVKDPKAKAKTFAHPIAYNSLPHIGSFNDDGFCSEEVKIMKETRKILGLPDLPVSAFAVRVPSLNGHSEAVWVKLKKTASYEQVKSSLQNATGIQFMEQNAPEEYPHVLAASGTDPVHVGRLHKDPNDENTWMMWVVADNLRKGAALNGLQIAEKIWDL